MSKLKFVERKEFFENYARQKGFDPLNPDNWYAQSRFLNADLLV
jgi:hypothetical protein